MSCVSGWETPFGLSDGQLSRRRAPASLIPRARSLVGPSAAALSPPPTARPAAHPPVPPQTLTLPVLLARLHLSRSQRPSPSTTPTPTTTAPALPALLLPPFLLQSRSLCLFCESSLPILRRLNPPEARSLISLSIALADSRDRGSRGPRLSAQGHGHFIHHHPPPASSVRPHDECAIRAMTSRPAPGINIHAQRPLAGDVQRVASRTHGVVQQSQRQHQLHHHQRHAVRQPETVIDLTDDGDNPSQDEQTQKARGTKSSSSSSASALPSAKSAAPNGVPLTIDTTSKSLPRGRPQLYYDTSSLTDSSSVAKSDQNTPTTSSSDKSLPTTGAAAPLPFPSRPGAHCPDRRRGAGRDGNSGSDGKPFPDMSLGVFEAPLSSKCFPQGSKPDTPLDRTCLH